MISIPTLLLASYSLINVLFLTAEAPTASITGHTLCVCVGVQHICLLGVLFLIYWPSLYSCFATLGL